MPQAYAGSLSVPNDYRCFVLDPHITKPTFITGYQVTPDHRAEIHHVQIFHIDPSQVAAGREDLRAATASPGGAATERSSCRRPSRTIRRGTSVPGLHRPGRTDRGLGARPGPGHLPRALGHPACSPATRSCCRCTTTTTPRRSPTARRSRSRPTRAPTNFKTIDIINPIAPVEIPCMPGRDRAAVQPQRRARRRRAPLRRRSARAPRPGCSSLCGKTYRAARGQLPQRRRVDDVRLPRLPESGTIVSVFGHEHTLGKTFRLTLDPDTAETDGAARHPDVELRLADELRAREADPRRTPARRSGWTCSWDRSLDPNRPPKYIVFAEGTEDEMCFSTYAIIPDDQS